MTNRVTMGFISVSEEDMVRHRELRGEIGVDLKLINGMESPNLVMSDLAPQTQQRILHILDSMDEEKILKAKENKELQDLYDHVSSFNHGSPYLRDMVRCMSSLLGYKLTTTFNLPRAPSAAPYQSYRVNGITRINDITEYTKCILTYLVDHWHQVELTDLSYAYSTIHHYFHKARLDFGYDNVYIDLTEKDTLRITGMYNSDVNGQVVKPFISFKLNEKELVVKRG